MAPCEYPWIHRQRGWFQPSGKYDNAKQNFGVSSLIHPLLPAFLDFQPDATAGRPVTPPDSAFESRDVTGTPPPKKAAVDPPSADHGLLLRAFRVLIVHKSGQTSAAGSSAGGGTSGGGSEASGSGTVGSDGRPAGSKTPSGRGGARASASKKGFKKQKKLTQEVPSPPPPPQLSLPQAQQAASAVVTAGLEKMTMVQLLHAAFVQFRDDPAEQEQQAATPPPQTVQRWKRRRRRTCRPPPHATDPPRPAAGNALLWPGMTVSQMLDLVRRVTNGSCNSPSRQPARRRSRGPSRSGCTTTKVTAFMF